MPAVVKPSANLTERPAVGRIVQAKLFNNRATALNKAASQAPKSSAEVLESPLKLRSLTPRIKSVMPASGAGEKRDHRWDEQRRAGFSFGL
jgi:hypothetical protein